MQLEQSITVAVAPEHVWAAFHDPQLLVSCLPGASLRGPVQDGRLPLLFKVKLGPIVAAFSGEGALALDEATHTGAISGQAADSKTNSRVKGEAGFTVKPAPEGTQVNVTVNFTITGSLAQFSREGIVRGLADQLTRQFAANLQNRITESAVVVPATAAPLSDVTTNPPEAASATPHEPPINRSSEAPALNGFALLGAMLKDYWRRLFEKQS
ncbi:MAG: SRPBCC family protein [Advenella sp.]